MPGCTIPEWAIVCEADRAAIAAGYYWDQNEADRIIRFAQKHVIPKYTKGDFELFEWQKRWLMRLYGWRSPGGERRFAQALLHVAKKNGKTLLVSIIAEFELICSKVGSPLVVSASTTKKNATQVFEQLRAMINRNRRLKKLLKIHESDKKVSYPKADGEYWSMSSDVGGAEGWNISCGIVDEAHAHRSPKLFNALEYGTAGRENGFLVVISTAGDDLTHFYYDLLCKGRNLLAGNDLDPTFMAEIYEVDPEKHDLESPSTWKKANPSLDCYPGFTSEKFRLAWEAAKKNTAKRLNFLRYRMNVFCRAENNTWIELAKWDLCLTPIDERILLESDCHLGFDGSQTIDPTSISAVWRLPGNRYFGRSWAWVAAAGLDFREAQNKPRYQQFQADGFMTVTEGNVIDKTPIRSFINNLRSLGHRVRTITMDPNMNHAFGNELAGDGFTVFRMPQSFAEYTDPMNELEAAVLDRRFTHDGNTWLRWCVNSLRVKVNESEQCRPVKSKSSDHIDGAVALLMAFKAAHAGLLPYVKSAYDSHGIEFLE